MKSRDFVYWLQGFFEIGNPETLSVDQVRMIKNHLNMVFHHEIDPSNGDKKHNEELAKFHKFKEESREKVGVSMGLPAADMVGSELAKSATEIRYNC